jgi:hypothetical protein
VIAVVVLHTQLHTVAVEAQRLDPAAAQRHRQPRGQPVDDLAMRRLHVLQPARFHGAERVRAGSQQHAHADRLGAGGVRDHYRLDLQSHQCVPGVRDGIGIHLEQSRIGIFGGNQVE